MRARISLALFLSVFLIGAAFWFRSAPPQDEDLIAVVTNDEFEQEFLRDFLEPSVVGIHSPSTELTNTDIIGRKLVLDYLSLAAAGENSPETVLTLIEEHLETIPSLSNTHNLSIGDLIIVPNSSDNIRKYSQSFALIYNDFGSKLRHGNFKLDDPDNLTSVSKMESIYTETALKLKDIPVPSSLSDLHLSLINNHLSNAAALKAIVNADVDAAAAFAGLIAINENSNKEIVLTSEISKILTSYAPR